VYVLEKGVYPKALETLVEADLLTEREYKKYGSVLNYRASGEQERYDLELVLKPTNTEGDP